MSYWSRTRDALLGTGAIATESAEEPTRRSVPVLFRRYAAAQHFRSALNFSATSSSADSELKNDLSVVRAGSRMLERDSSYAKRAKTIVVNNVIGSGVGLQGQVKSTRNRLQKRINSEIEDLFREWSRAEYCHTGGALHFHDIERMVMGQVFDAGEVFLRFHNRAFAGSPVPFAIEVVESERVPERITYEGGPDVDMSQARLGIQVDQFHRATGYWIRDRHVNEQYFRPLDPVSSRVQLIDAVDVLHLRVITRWPQTRGVPWMHVAAGKLNDMNGYTEAEIVAARAAANYVAFIERDDWENPAYEIAEDGTIEMSLEPGTMPRLQPGEKVHDFSPNRPNSALDPFMRYMLREVAAGINVSYESLSRDYSQSNYSSSRLSLLDDRDSWRTLQTWYIRAFRDVLHRKWLQSAVLSGALSSVASGEYMMNSAKFEAVKFKPRGWSWVDPQKEVAAYKEAIRGGLTTRTQVISATAEGRDVEDIDEERAQELEQQGQLGLSFDTDPESRQSATESTLETQAAKDRADEERDQQQQRMRVVR